MKRFVSTALLCAASYLAGYAMSPGTGLAAQAQAGRGRGRAAPPAEGKGLHWTIEDLKKVHEGTRIAFPTSPFYRIGATRYNHIDAPKLSGTKVMSQWDDAEIHDDRTDFYIILGGSGTEILGGELENSVEVSPGEHHGQPVKGGTAYKVKAGDVLLIPPRTAHWHKADPGGLTYLNLTMATRTTPP